jgi:hypothetical protein
MRQLLNQLMKDQTGMILSSEIVLVGTILVLGSIVGLVSVSSAVNHELNDCANAYQANNGYQPGYQNGGNDYNNPYQNTNSYQYTIGDSQGIPEVVGY